jgi:predicted RNA-binding Zn ribbon-like protein
MRAMAERLAAGNPVSQAAVDAVNQALRHRLGYPQICRRRGVFERKYQAEFRNSNPVLGLLAEAATDLLIACDPSLVKKCQNPACVLFFYDTTKNHARHWCSMSLCGNRSKVAAHYHRHRERKT